MKATSRATETLDLATHIKVTGPPIPGLEDFQNGERRDLTGRRPVALRHFEANGQLLRLPVGTPEEEAKKQRRRDELRLAQKDALSASLREDLLAAVVRRQEADAAKEELERVMRTRDAVLREQVSAERAHQALAARLRELQAETDELRAVLEPGVAA